MIIQNDAGTGLSVGNMNEWRDEFRTFNPAEWEVIQTNTGASITASGTTGGARWLNINSGTVIGETIIQTRRSWRLPLIARAAISLSQRISNQDAFFEIVGVDGRGNVETDTGVAASTTLLDASNAAAYQFTGVSATAATFLSRGFGCPEIASAGQQTATTLGTGSPNWLPGAVFDLVVDNEKIAWLSRVIDGVGTAVGGTANRTQKLLDPTKRYKIRIRIRNIAVVAAADLRVHHVRVSQLSPLSIDWQKVMGMADNASNSLPVSITNYAYGTPLGAGTALVGDVGVQYRATTSNASRYHFVSAATTNAINLKATAGKVLGWWFANTTAAAKFVKLHNASVTPTAGAGVVHVIGVPPNGATSFMSEGGIFFSTGIGLTCVNLPADADATAVAAGDVVGGLMWI